MYREIQEERNALLASRKIIVQRMAKLPEGRFRAYVEGKYTKWYVYLLDKTIGKNIKKYIPKDKRRLAERHCQRTVLEYQLEDIDNKIKAADSYLRIYKQGSKAQKYLNSSPEYRELARPVLDLDSQEQRKWADNYIKLASHPEQLTVKASDDNFYRSKSEAIIASRLYENKIPYRYESKTELACGRAVFPDFTILHPRTGRIYIWEHLGLMDQPQYVDKNIKKIAEYSSSGYTLMDNLIVTMEHEDAHLDITYIDHIIRQYFL